MFLPSVCSTSQYFQHCNKNERIDTLVQYDTIVGLRARKRETGEAYESSAAAAVDERTFINARGLILFTRQKA